MKQVLCLAFLAFAPAQEFTQDPTAFAWKQFDVGSHAKFSTTHKEGGKESKPIESVWTLAKNEAKSVTVTIEETGPKREVTFPLESTAWAGAKSKDLGTREFAIDTKKFECRGVEFEVEGNRRTLWSCDGIPGRIIEETADIGGMKEETKLLRLSDEVDLGKHKFKCWMTETVADFGGGIKQTTREWKCKEVPGWMVKRETILTRKTGGDIVSTMVLVESFQPKK
jgi:hypothetical protein